MTHASHSTVPNALPWDAHPLTHLSVATWRLSSRICRWLDHTVPIFVRWVLFLCVAAMMLRTICILGVALMTSLNFYTNVDSDIYLAVGRGILNGFKPYKDLFETKPPAIFLLSAFSLWTAGSMALALWIQTFIIATLSLPLHILAWKRSVKMKLLPRLLFLATSLLFGILLSLYLFMRTGDELQVEPFGAFFGVLYAFVLAVPFKNRITQVVAATLCMFCAVGFKEPFLFTCAGSALILCKSPKAFWRDFVVPLQLTILSGVLVLAIFGYLIPYLSIYLPHMIGYHISAFGSPWERGLLAGITFADIEFAYPFLGAAILVMIASVAILRGFSRKRKYLFPLDIALVATAAYLALFSVGLGGQYFWHHFIFAIPFYATLFFEFLKLASETSFRRIRTFSITALASVLCVAGIHAPNINPRQHRVGDDLVVSTETLAAQIDNILDDCKIPQYLFIGGNGIQPFGKTKHSPIGPFFFQLPEFFENGRETMRDNFLKQLRTTSFIVLNGNNTGALFDETEEYLDENFTQTPWPCAKNAPEPARWDYRFFYKTLRKVEP